MAVSIIFPLSFVVRLSVLNVLVNPDPPMLRVRWFHVVERAFISPDKHTTASVGAGALAGAGINLACAHDFAE